MISLTNSIDLTDSPDYITQTCFIFSLDAIVAEKARISLVIIACHFLSVYSVQSIIVLQMVI